MGKNFGENLFKIRSLNALKTALKRAIQKSVEATGNLICNKTAHKVEKVLKNHNKIVTNKYGKEIPKERYISTEKEKKLLII